MKTRLGTYYSLSDVVPTPRLRKVQKSIKVSDSEIINQSLEKPRTKDYLNSSFDLDWDTNFTSSKCKRTANLRDMYCVNDDVSVVHGGHDEEIVRGLQAVRIRSRVEMDDGAMRIPCFTGTQDVTEFFKKYEIVSFAKELTEAQMARWVPMYLQGPAMMFYEGLDDGEKLNYEHVKSLMLRQFGELDSRAVLVARLHATVQREGESVIRFTNRFEEIARRAYADMRGEHIKTLTLLQYQNSLLPHIRKHVLLKQPTSITEAQ